MLQSCVYAFLGATTVLLHNYPHLHTCHCCFLCSELNINLFVCRSGFCLCAGNAKEIQFLGIYDFHCNKNPTNLLLRFDD